MFTLYRTLRLLVVVLLLGPIITGLTVIGFVGGVLQPGAPGPAPGP